MKSLKAIAGKMLLAVAILGAAAFTVGSANEAEAARWTYGYSSYYHAPSYHYHRTYHHEYTHWTPSRGLHSHGHYHYQRHYTPGHWHW